MTTVLSLIEDCALELQAAHESGRLAFGHGTDNAFDEAAWLVLWRLSLPLDDLDGVAHRELTTDQVKQCQSLVRLRISSRKPAAYLTHEAWLQGVPFYVDERSIVPRSFIAELICDGSLDPWLGPHTQRVLDLCTGNGSLAVLMALHDEQVRVVGADLSEAALEIARINVEKHQLAARIQLVQSDCLQSVSGIFDVILCNPPYVNDTSMQALPPEYLAEPRMALAGGSDGMDFIRRLLSTAPEHLSRDGVLVLEIGHEREHFERAFPRLHVYWLLTSAGDDQVVLIQRQDLVNHLHAVA